MQRRFDGLVGAMIRDSAGALSEAVERFGKVSRSYRPGLFHCYNVPDLPRTNKALRQAFGSQRHHECRASGRKTASPALVLRGEARLIAAVATRQHPPGGADLGRVDRQRWNDLRQRSTKKARPASCAPASAAIQMPIWQNWNKRPAS
ncbi:hypothetical protein [Rhodopila globiformis]|uniref:hypothetical protein n=1 Tax=Rhodopila globiformis TaxID=1071 RepID=UPI0011B039B7|nr:hypothetical protein [Rhodopila globiformis]